MWINERLDEIRNFIKVLNKDVIKKHSDKQLITDLKNKEKNIDLEITLIKDKTSILSSAFCNLLKLITLNYIRYDELNDDKILFLSSHLYALADISQEQASDYITHISEFLSDDIIERINNDFDPLNESTKNDDGWFPSGNHKGFSDTTYTETTTESYYSTGLDDGGVAESLGE